MEKLIVLSNYERQNRVFRCHCFPTFFDMKLIMSFLDGFGI
nr:MAG TPA: hypothetical protein [Caudoviricetes sp.]